MLANISQKEGMMMLRGSGVAGDPGSEATRTGSAKIGLAGSVPSR